MNSLATSFELAISSAIKEYINNIYSQHPEIPNGKLEELWNSTANSVQLSVSFKKSSTSSSSKSKPTPIKSKAKDSDDDNEDNEDKKSQSEQSGCIYKYIKGANKDQLCGSKPKEGNVFCSRHKKHEGTEIKERKLTPSSKMTNTAFTQEKSKPKSVAKDVQRVLRKHKTLGKLWHQESGLVFKCAKDRVVIGKCVNDTLNELTESDIEECRKWGFSFNAIDEKTETESCEKIETKESYLVLESENKFWNCKADGLSYITKYGKIGKEGKTKTKECESNDEAISIMNKNVKSKLNKGYTEKNDIKKIILETMGIKKDSEVVKNIKKTKSTASPKKDSDSDSDQSEDEVVKNIKKTKSTASPKKDSDSDQSEDEVVKNIKKTKSTASPKKDSDGDQSEDEEVKNIKKTKSTASPKKDSDGDQSEDEEELEYEEELVDEDQSE
jgi:predicted DNA-binding WGR domain protein